MHAGINEETNKSGILLRFITIFTALAVALPVFLYPEFIVYADEETEGEENGTDLSTENNYVVETVDPIYSDNWSSVLYDAANGLPSSEANDIAETGDGFIWIGSYAGLIRYDGHEFVRTGADQGITSVKSLLVDSNDRLWIGCNDKGVYMKDDSKYYHWGKEAGLPATSVRDIVEDNNGNIYIATSGGLVIIDPNLELVHSNDDRVDEDFILDLEKGPGNIIYGLTNGGDMFTLKNRILINYVDHMDTPFTEGLSNIFPDPNNPGYIYLETKENKVLYGTLSDRFQWTKEVDVGGLVEIQDFTMLNDKLWICARNGIGMIDENGVHRLTDCKMTNSVVNLHVDYAGNLWFASSRQGVMKIVPNQFSDLFDSYGLDERMCNAVCIRDDDIFIGTDNGLIVLDRSTHTVLDEYPIASSVTAGGVDLEYTDLMELLDGARIRSILKDNEGRIWFSTWRRYGLLCLDGDNLTAYTSNDGMPTEQVRMIREMSDGRIVAVVSGGLVIIKDGKVVKVYDEDDGLNNTELLCAEVNDRGDILVGTDGGGIFLINASGGIRSFTSAQGLESENVMRIKFDSYHGIYWIITGNSIAYMNEQYQIRTLKNFPFSNNFDLYQNEDGTMCVLSSNGIYFIPLDQMIMDEDTAALHFAIEEGLPAITTANSYSYLDSDGTLYIPSTSCITVVNINTITDNFGFAKFSVPYIEADGKLIYPEEDGIFHLDKDVRKVTIYPYVFNYSLINPMVSYKLDGFDDDYTTVQRNELDPVTYTNLAGGDYYFDFMVSDFDYDQFAEMRILIRKERNFHEYPLFWVLLAAAFGIAMYAFVRTYTARQLRKLEEKHREEAEKERMANELNMAARIQTSSLQTEFPLFPDRTDFDVYAAMDPAREVGGDFYDIIMLDENHAAFVIADVSGKGIPSALYMMISKTLLQYSAMQNNSPSEILAKTNEALCARNEVQMFVTAWIAIIDLKTGHVTAANAGHEFPAIMHKGHDFELFKDKHGLVLGAMSGVKYREYELDLGPGDKIFVYTDGVPEAIDNDKNQYGTDRMIDALNTARDEDPQKILEVVRASIDEFIQGAEQFDDLTMMCIQYNGPAGKDEDAC